jgi:formate hydrogenlyase subunit 3/multisubunit Na+/H+ antiporter MnhD subunit
MSILPLIPIAILLGAALIVALSRLVRFQFPDAIAAVASFAALLALLPLIGSAPVETLVSTWKPLSVFGAPVSLRVERLDWLAGLIAALIALSTSAASLVYPGRRRFGLCAAGLGMTAMIIASAFSANLLTLALAWGLFDAFYSTMLLAQGKSGESVRRAAFVIALNGAATLCIGIAALILNQASQSQYWHLTILPETARGLLAVAAVLRLGLYPLSQWLPIDRRDAPGRAALLYVMPSLVGLYMLIRLGSLNALPEGTWLAWLGAISMLAGGVLAWWRGQSHDVLPYVSVSGVGAVVLAGSLTDMPGSVLVSGAASWALAITVFSIGRSLDMRAPWWSIGHALAIATFAGLPASLGFALRTNLVAGVASSGNWPLILVSLIAETLTFGAIVRLALTPATDEAPTHRLRLIAYAAGIGLAALPIFLLPALARSVVPEVTPPAFEIVLSKLGALGGVLIVLPIFLAGLLIWRGGLPSPAVGGGDSRFVSRVDLSRIVGLDWLYRIVYWVVNTVARSLRGFASLIEGEGALLWAILILIAAYVVWSGAVP